METARNVPPGTLDSARCGKTAFNKINLGGKHLVVMQDVCVDLQVFRKHFRGV